MAARPLPEPQGQVPEGSGPSTGRRQTATYSARGRGRGSRRGPGPPLPRRRAHGRASERRTEGESSPLVRPPQGQATVADLRFRISELPSASHRGRLAGRAKASAPSTEGAAALRSPASPPPERGNAEVPCTGLSLRPLEVVPLACSVLTTPISRPHKSPAHCAKPLTGLLRQARGEGGRLSPGSTPYGAAGVVTSRNHRRPRHFHPAPLPHLARSGAGWPRRLAACRYQESQGQSWVIERGLPSLAKGEISARTLMPLPRRTLSALSPACPIRPPSHTAPKGLD